jgi:hypothetical protein
MELGKEVVGEIGESEQKKVAKFVVVVKKRSTDVRFQKKVVKFFVRLNTPLHTGPELRARPPEKFLREIRPPKPKNPTPPMPWVFPHTVCVIACCISVGLHATGAIQSTLTELKIRNILD